MLVINLRIRYLPTTRTLNTPLQDWDLPARILWYSNWYHCSILTRPVNFFPEQVFPFTRSLLWPVNTLIVLDDVVLEGQWLPWTKLPTLLVDLYWDRLRSGPGVLMLQVVCGWERGRDFVWPRAEFAALSPPDSSSIPPCNQAVAGFL